MSTKIKICGIKNKEIAEQIIKYKPDYLGIVVDFPKSPRSVSLENLNNVVIPAFKGWVYLFVNHSLETIGAAYRIFKPLVFQFHGNETPEFIKSIKNQYPVEIWKAVNLETKNVENSLIQIDRYIEAGVNKILIDSIDKNSFGGTGIKADWDLIKANLEKIKAPIVLAGGLTPENVIDGIIKLNPEVVDVSSGVEKIKGVKDLALVQSFIDSVRKAKY